MAFRFETLDAARHNREGFRSTDEALNNGPFMLEPLAVRLIRFAKPLI